MQSVFANDEKIENHDGGISNVSARVQERAESFSVAHAEDSFPGPEVNSKIEVTASAEFR